MFKVDVDTLESYLNFDPPRKADLEGLDGVMRVAAPGLTRYFHAGTPPGEPGMRFKMIGYGPFHYAAATGKAVLWPAVGVALQKNYISVYVAVQKDGAPVCDAYRGRLGELRSGRGNFSFVRFADLDAGVLATLMEEAERLFLTDPHSLPNRVN